MISIIIPIYNAEKYLERTILSVKNQTIADWELILINDCSTDSSKQIMEDYSRNDERIISITLDKNSGPARARNTGIKKAKRKYIAFVDADDYISQKFAETLINAAEQNDSDIVWCQYIEVVNGNQVYKNCGLSESPNYDKKEALRGFYNQVQGIGSLCNKIYKRNFIEENNLLLNEKRTRAEDWDLNLRAFTKLGRLTIIPDYLYYYVRENESSVMSTFREKDFDLMCDSSILLEQINKEYNLNIPCGFDNNANSKFFIEYLLKGACQSTSTANRIIRKILYSPKFQEVMRLCNKSELPLTYKVIRLSTLTRYPWLVKITCRLINKVK